MKAGLPIHFGIAVGGVSLAYCYIRKNACSAWKRLFVGESGTPFRRDDWKSEFAFILAHHRLRTIADIDRCDRRIVVVRDPVDRYVSAFISLLVARTPPPTRRLRALSEEVFHRNVFDLSFDLLLERQLPGPDTGRRRLEKHFWPQVWHLAPTAYTDVVDIAGLGREMNRLIGKKLGTQYFDKAVNATSTTGTYEDEESPTLSARILIERFKSTGLLPSKTSFTHGGREVAIRDAYDEDASLFAACRAHQETHPGTSMALRIADKSRRSPKDKGDLRQSGRAAGRSHRKHRAESRR